MNTKQKSPLSPPPASISLRDIYYVLFRHKWLILLLTALGVASSLAVYSLWHFPYFSEARIFIRYIQDIPATIDMDDGPGNGSAAMMRTPDNKGDSIMNTEVQILSSADLAMQVATNLGPKTILGKTSESNDVISVARAVSANLKAETAKSSDVIVLTFSSDNQMLPQQVLAGIIAAYKNKYLEIHMTPSFTDASLQEQTDNARLRLQDTTKALEDQKAKLHITDVSVAAKNVADQIARIEENIFQTESDLAEAEASIKDLRERIPSAMIGASATNQSNNIASDAQLPPPSPEVVAKYQNLNAILSVRRQKEQDLENQFTSNNKLVQNAQQQREAAEADVKKFEVQNPGLTALKTNTIVGSSLPLAAGMDPIEKLREALTRQHTLVAKYHELTNQLTLVQTNASQLDYSENIIMQAQTEMEVARKKYDHFLKATEQARINDAIGNKVSGISIVEQPTYPARDLKKILKATGGVLAFFLVLAFGLPFLIEMVLDQSFKHPLDVQARIAAPFFITIPKTNGHSKLAALKRAKQVPLLTVNGNGSQQTDPGTEVQTVPPPTNGQLAAWDQRHELRPYFDSLRDRLMTYFEMINLTHKPKLVAVTSCSDGAGVTTTAAGLASSLSETGEGNVLLVSMNVRDGEAHHFYKGKLNCGIEDVLGREKRDNAHVHDKLYVAKEMESDDSLPRVLPKRFSHLLPLMKASDFDYIIFDMPPVSEISITPRLARFMDMVLLVIESEKTPRDTATRAASLLAESKTNVGLVLNKNRSYIPKRLDHSI